MGPLYLSTFQISFSHFGAFCLSPSCALFLLFSFVFSLVLPPAFFHIFSSRLSSLKVSNNFFLRLYSSLFVLFLNHHKNPLSTPYKSAANSMRSHRNVLVILEAFGNQPSYIRTCRFVKVHSKYCQCITQ